MTPVRLCPKCGGAGRAGAAVVTEFPPLWIPCEVCKGTSVVEDDRAVEGEGHSDD